jgi:hypothetical protein
LELWVGVNRRPIYIRIRHILSLKTVDKSEYQSDLLVLRGARLRQETYSELTPPPNADSSPDRAILTY